MNNTIYDETISESKAESILKAISILEAETKNDAEKAINRPNIDVKKTLAKHLLCIFGFFIVCVLLYLFLIRVGLRDAYIFIVLIFLGLILVLICFKKFCVDFILIYQKLAPEKLRHSCLFEPSCSEYMLLAIEKYGVYKGVFKGIKRLLRCHHPNGGVDYP